MRKGSWSRYLHETLNSITHGAGVLLSIAGLVLLLVFASGTNESAWKIVSFSLYGTSLILMFTASTIFHSVRNPKTKEFLNLLDHSAIYILIAGTYTPFTLVSMRGGWGWSIFGVIWALAIAGVIFKLFFYSEKYRLISAILYLIMGWIIIIALRPLIKSVPPGGLWWLLTGALSFSLGVIFYLRRQNRFNHVIWHLFVLGGTISHFFAIFLHVLPK